MELRSLLEVDVPEARHHLEASCANLERVAAYCEANYAQATDKRAAFEETKRYTVQSLASVAYQVNSLATALLQTLSLQTEKVAEMGNQVNCIQQVVIVHKEKVARREIGLLTTNKTVERQPKIIAPAVQERSTRYQRTPIDYSMLDGLGHGVRTEQNRPRLSRASSTTTPSQHFPNSEHILPKAHISSTLSRVSVTRSDNARLSGLRDPETMSATGSNYSAGYGLNPPSSVLLGQGHSRLSSTSNADCLPPPPAESVFDEDPLPPPPPFVSPVYASGNATLGGAGGDWRPRVFIERALVLYDYEAQKADELSLREQSVVYVLRKNEDGWFEGVGTGGLTGLFPGNYVQPL